MEFHPVKNCYCVEVYCGQKPRTTQSKRCFPHPSCDPFPLWKVTTVVRNYEMFPHMKCCKKYKSIELKILPSRYIWSFVFSCLHIWWVFAKGAWPQSQQSLIQAVYEGSTFHSINLRMCFCWCLLVLNLYINIHHYHPLTSQEHTVVVKDHPKHWPSSFHSICMSTYTLAALCTQW